MDKTVFDAKTLKKNLNNYAYVMGLKSLTPSERQFLVSKYPQEIYKKFPIPFGKIKNIDDAKKIFAKTLADVEKFIKDNNVQNPVIDNRGYYNAITVIGEYLSTDAELIKERQYAVKRLKSIKDDIAKRNKMNKERASACAIKNVMVCTSKADAAAVIRKLKNRFDL